MSFLQLNGGACRMFSAFALLTILLTIIAPSLARAETSQLAKFKGVWVLKENNNAELVTVSKISGQGWKVTAQGLDAVVDEVNAYHLLIHTTMGNGSILNYHSLALTGDDSAMEEFYQMNNGQRSEMMEQHMNLIRKPK